MPDTKVAVLSAISTIDTTLDAIPIVDVSDTTMAISGTTKKISVSQILSAGTNVVVPAGTAGAPSISFSGDSNTGIYAPAADQLSISSGGSGNATVSSTGLSVTGLVSATSTITGTQLISTLATGTAPLSINSTTLVSNLNADLLDGQHGTYYQDASNITAGTLAVTRGGTGILSYAIGDLIYASAATTLAKLASVASGSVLVSGGVATAPSWGKVELDIHVSKILPIANGGTGASTFTAGRVLFGNGTSALNTSANLFWDNASNRLGIGTATPATALHVFGTGSQALSVERDGATIQSRLEIVSGNSTNLIRATVAKDLLVEQGTGTEVIRIATNGVCTWSNVGGVAGTAMTLNGDGLGVGIGPVAGYKITTNGNLGLQYGSELRLINTDNSSAYAIKSVGTGGGIKLYFTIPGIADRMVLDYNGNLIRGATAADTTSTDSATMVNIGNFAVQNAASSGTFLAVKPGAANGTVDICADARSGNYPNLRFFTSSTTQMTLTAGGNLGLGVTPSAWGAGLKALQVGAVSYGSLFDFGNGVTSLSSNLFFSGSSYGRMSTSSRWSMAYWQDITNGAHSWVTSTAAGTNASTPTMSTLMLLDASGNLGLGVTPSSTIFSGDETRFVVKGNANYYAGTIAVQSKGTVNAVTGFLTATDGSNAVHVGALTNSDLIFYTNGTSKATLNAAGNLGLGVTPAHRLNVVRTGDGITAGISGGTYGIRFDNGGTFSSGMSTIHGVDSTLTGSYQPIMVNGSDVRFGIAGNLKMLLDSSGNLGLGVTPSAWQANWKVLQFANGSSIGNPFNGEGTFVGSNVYRNSSGDYIRLDTGYAAMYMQLSGSHRWHVAGTSNAGSTIPSFSPGSQAMTLDASGRLMVGTASARSNFFNSSVTTQLQVEGDGAASFVRNVNDVYGGVLVLGKIRGTSIVQNNDRVSQISFQGSDGTEFVECANISAEIDGAPGANDMPGRLVFSTTSDGAAAPTERLRITSAGVSEFSGNISMGTGYQVLLTDGAASAPGAAFTADTNTGIYRPAADTVAVVTGGVERAKVDSSGNVVVNTAGVATNATSGFLWIPSCAGTPTGSPTAPYTNAVALVWDRTNNKLYVYDGGWVEALPPA